MVEQGHRVFWALQGVLLGGLALLAGLTLQREGAMDKLNREVGEIRGLLVAVGSREATFEEKVQIMSEYMYKSLFLTLEARPQADAIQC